MIHSSTESDGLVYNTQFIYDTVPSATTTFHPKNYTEPLMFLGQDLPSNLQNHNFNIDQLISNHMENMRNEIEEKKKLQRSKIIQSVQQVLMKSIRDKDEEINHIAKLNHFLEEKVKSLSVDNQIWRDVAQSNGATVNALRSNLQQALSAVERNGREETTAADDDAESCCGNSDEEMWRIAEEAQDKDKKRRMIAKGIMCRRCGEGEASVLLLPCRHMCLCTLCGSCLNTCPICTSPKNASLHVNLSS